MKNKIRTLLIAFICMAATLSSVPASVNPFETTTVEAATIEKNGLYHEESNWNYYTDNAINKSSTLVKYNGSWWYVHDGEVDFNARTVVKFNGAWWFVENGKVDFSARTLCKYNGTWWYVKNGKVDFNYNGLCKYNGSWWYVRSGKVDFSARTLCKYNGTWWYVNGGRVDFNSTTVVRYGSTWYYVKGGQVHWNDTGLCKYNGNWWYIDNGRINFSDRTLVKYNGTWWFVENGKVNFNSGKTLCKYNGTWWYVRDGQVCWKNVSVSGDDFVTYNGYRYGCKNGQVDWNCKIEKSHVHKYNSGVVTKAPTCKDTGIKTYTCVNNDDSYTETIPALGHDPGQRTETVTVKEAYDEPVLEPRYICNGCGEQFKTAREVGRHMVLAYHANHDTKCCNYYEEDVQVNTIYHPAETKTNTYKVCSRCGERL